MVMGKEMATEMAMGGVIRRFRPFGVTGHC